MSKIQAIRGMHDILPDETPLWRRVENIATTVIQSYDYHEIRLPLVEKTELFARSIGAGTDIVSKEMYTFADRNEDLLTLRPEGTAGCLRAAMEHGLLHNQTWKLWYMGPMFRHERPQRGRQRQFHQIGLEAYGFAGPDIDAELILLCTRIWKKLGLQSITLQLNTLGTTADRARYRDALVSYFSQHRSQLDDDSLRRLEVNPLRILDSKNPAMQDVINGAPGIQDYLGAESLEHFAGLKQLLDSAGITYLINPRLVRGLDYYSNTVFEWTTEQLGAQGTICAGGRYDGLIEHFGGKPSPAIGCAMGLERLIELAHHQDHTSVQPHVYVVVDKDAVATALQLAETLRDSLPGIRISTHTGSGSFKNQFKKADRSGAEYALVLGPDELRQQSVSIKPLRQDGNQINLPMPALPEWLCERLDLN